MKGIITIKNFNINMLLPVPAKKLGKDFKLNKDTAKQLYFIEYCDLEYENKEIIKWFKENFDEETLMSWRCEFILKSIDETYELINKNPNKNEFKEILKNIYFMIPLFIKDKEILDKEINLLIHLSNKLGNFYYMLCGEDHEYARIDKNLLSGNNIKKDSYGFIHNLMILGYDDLVEKTINKVIIPSLISYPNESEYMKKMGLEYLYFESDERLNKRDLRYYLEYFKGTKFEKSLSDVKL